MWFDWSLEMPRSDPFQPDRSELPYSVELDSLHGYDLIMNAKTLIALINRYATGLRFPQLFLFTAALFVIDVIVPDFLPFADEILLALGTVLLASWKNQRSGGLENEPAGGSESQPNPQSER